MENTRIKGLTILKNGQLLTMNDGPVLKDADLWIENGKIVKISDRKETIPENADVIDISGCVVMPGMIDSHVHYDESYMGDFFLASGVTSVRNMQGFAGHAKWRDEILAGTRRGPYIYSSGPIADGEDPTIPDNTNIIIRTKEEEFLLRSDCWLITYAGRQALRQWVAATAPARRSSRARVTA